jgi:phenylalanyl-tRNA synthetase beta chain
MKISYNWLSTLIKTDLSAEACATRLTACGLEVEGIEEIESVPGGLRGLVVGSVESCEKHPDADRLHLTKVNIGTGELLSIVCGAPNVAAGQKVIVATIGAKLYPTEGEPFEIKKSKIRGALSEGMLCAEDEIGLGKSHAGIMVLPETTAVGTPAADYFRVETDTLLEIGLTPNRSDAASHLGVARDLAAILNSDPALTQKVHTQITGIDALPPALGDKKIKVTIAQTETCRRYSGVVISGIKVGASPSWLKNRLQSIGLRSINNVVDVTNFVLHELGQPLHAFDLDQIEGHHILVRPAKSGEKFTTLDGIQRELKEGDLMICDEQKPLCIAGVFGGAESGVTEKTTSIFLESAYFDSAHVRRSAKNHGLKTDASFRFERGTDPEMTVTALLRCANLILELTGGKVSTEILDLYPEKLEPYRVGFSFSNCADLIGKEIDRQIVFNIIKYLGIVIENEGNDGLLLAVPRYKTDVTREADVIEEVMRIYGYNNVEVSKSISYTSFISPRHFDQELEEKLCTLLEGFGFYEMMNLSLSSEAYYEEKSALVKVLSPLSADLNVMRGELLFGGLQTLAHNINRRNADLKFFEIGRRYALNAEEGAYTEEKQLLLLCTGELYPQNAYQLQRPADLHYLKGVCENLLRKCGIDQMSYEELRDTNYAYGLQASLNKKPLFKIGAVSTEALKKLDVSQAVMAAVIDWQPVLKALSKNKTQFTELNKYPSVRRDLALLIDRQVDFNAVRDLAYATERKLLSEVNLFDIYEGEKLGNKKSYAVSFILSNKEATLNDKQIDGVMEKLITAYKEKLGAELR